MLTNCFYDYFLFPQHPKYRSQTVCEIKTHTYLHTYVVIDQLKDHFAAREKSGQHLFDVYTKARASKRKSNIKNPMTTGK